MFPYIPISKEDEKTMLDVIGVDSVDDLFVDIPTSLKLNRPLNIPNQKSEIEIRNLLHKLAKKNHSTSDYLCFFPPDDLVLLDLVFPSRTSPE